MLLRHEIPLPIPPEQAWDVLLDLSRVAHCMPGAVLDRADGDEFSGRLTIKVGPLLMAYQGDGRIVDKDAGAGRLAMVVTGGETRGAGTAHARITASLHPTDGGTRVALETDLALTGRAARFGQGLVDEVAGTVLGQFAGRLAHEMPDGGGQAPGLPPVPVAPEPARRAEAAGPPPRAGTVLEPAQRTSRWPQAAAPSAAVVAALAVVLSCRTRRHRPS